MDIGVTYRDPAPPAPKMFRLDAGAASPIGLLAALLTAAISIVALAFGAGFFVFFVFALGPTLGYLLGGAPRRVEVHHDRVVLRFWLRPTKELPASELQVQRMEDELVLVHGATTYAVAREHFPGGSFDACASALRAVAAQTVVPGAR